MGEASTARSPFSAHAHQQWVSSVAGNFAARLFALFAAVIVARVLGPGGRGTLAAVMLWPTIVAGASIVNLPSVTYFVTKRGAVGFKTNAWLGVAMAALLTPLSIAITWFAMRDQPSSAQYARWFSLVVPLTIAGSLVGGTLLAQERVGGFWLMRATVTSVVATAVVLLAGLRLLSVGSYLSAVLVATSISLVVGLALQARFNSHEPGYRELVPDVVRYGGRTLLTQMAASLNMRLDQMFIAVMLPPAVLGQYTVALSWASSVYVVSSALGTVVLSRTARVNVMDLEKQEAAIARVRRTGIAGFFVAVGVSAFAPVAIPLIFGSHYRDAIAPAVLLSLGAGAVAWKGFLHEFARATGQPSLGRLPELIGIIVRAGGTYVVLTKLGGAGAAAVSLGAGLTIVFVFITRLARCIGIPSSALVPGLADGRFVISAALDYLRHQRSRAIRAISG